MDQAVCLVAREIAEPSFEDYFFLIPNAPGGAAGLFIDAAKDRPCSVTDRVEVIAADRAALVQCELEDALGHFIFTPHQAEDTDRLPLILGVLLD